MQILSDGERAADVDNPRGYLEWERIKRLPRDPTCIAEAEGKAVKVISLLLLSLPEGHDYRVVFMQRPLPEVLASQQAMMRNRKTTGADVSLIAGAFEKNLRAVDAWLDSKPYVKTLRVPYHDVLQDARAIAQKLTDFLEVPLNLDGMTQQIDTTLYRNRSK